MMTRTHTTKRLGNKTLGRISTQPLRPMDDHVQRPSSMNLEEEDPAIFSFWKNKIFTYRTELTT
jgi:hypothetical protein